MLLFGAMGSTADCCFFYAATARSLRRARWVPSWAAPSASSPPRLRAGMLLYRRDWRGAALLAAITLSGRLLVSLQKDWTARIRPAPKASRPVESLSFRAPRRQRHLGVAVPGAARAAHRSVRTYAVWGGLLALAVGASRVVLGVTGRAT